MVQNWLALHPIGGDSLSTAAARLHHNSSQALVLKMRGRFSFCVFGTAIAECRIGQFSERDQTLNPTSRPGSGLEIRQFPNLGQFQLAHVPLKRRILIKDYERPVFEENFQVFQPLTGRAKTLSNEIGQ